MAAGLEDFAEGEIRIGDRIVNRAASEDRDIAGVFLNQALCPHMAFGLKSRQTPQERASRGPAT